MTPPAAWRRLAELATRLHRTLGAPGLMIGGFALLTFVFGLIVLAREYDRYRVSTSDTLRQLIGRWVKTASADYLSRQTLVDFAARWRRADPGDGEEARRALERALDELGQDFERQADRTPWIDIVTMSLTTGEGAPIASWRSRNAAVAETRLLADIPVLPGSGADPPVSLIVRYRVSPEIDRGLGGLEASYRRLLLALLGLSGYSLLCFGYMIQHASALRERVAREAAQEATLDLADRTCHELGNIVFVLANERRNLADHLDLVDRFVAQEADARVSALRRAGIETAAVSRFERALQREYADRGIDPAVEIAGSLAMARAVCRQIEIGTHYVALTVRELDTYLRHSSTPLQPEWLRFSACLDDALALLSPKLEATGAQVERPAADPVVRADRRLLVHALVNLLKNGIEAAAGVGEVPRLAIGVEVRDETVTIDVNDNGPGIDPKVRPHLFEPGWTTKGSGRGRGLAIVRDALLAQHGAIEATRSAHGGTCFRLSLPGRPS